MTHEVKIFRLTITRFDLGIDGDDFAGIDSHPADIIDIVFVIIVILQAILGIFGDHVNVGFVLLAARRSVTLKGRNDATNTICHFAA